MIIKDRSRRRGWKLVSFWYKRPSLRSRVPFYSHQFKNQAIAYRQWQKGKEAPHTVVWR